MPAILFVLCRRDIFADGSVATTIEDKRSVRHIRCGCMCERASASDTKWQNDSTSCVIDWVDTERDGRRSECVDCFMNDWGTVYGRDVITVYFYCIITTTATATSTDFYVGPLSVRQQLPHTHSRSRKDSTQHLAVFMRRFYTMSHDNKNKTESLLGQFFRHCLSLSLWLLLLFVKWNSIAAQVVAWRFLCMGSSVRAA